MKDDVMLWCDVNVRYVVMGFLIFTNQKSNSLMIDSSPDTSQTIFIWVETITVPFLNISAWPSFRTGGQNWISLHISSAATNSSTTNSSTINKSTNNIIAPTRTEAGAAPRLLRDVSEWGREAEWVSEQKHNIIKGLVDGCTDKAIKLNMTHTQMCSCFFFLSILMRSKGRGRRGREEWEFNNTFFYYL